MWSQRPGKREWAFQCCPFSIPKSCPWGLIGRHTRGRDPAWERDPSGAVAAFSMSSPRSADLSDTQDLFYCPKPGKEHCGASLLVGEATVRYTSIRGSHGKTATC